MRIKANPEILFLFKIIEDRLKALKNDQEIQLKVSSLYPQDSIHPGTCITLKILLDDE